MDLRASSNDSVCRMEPRWILSGEWVSAKAALSVIPLRLPSTTVSRRTTVVEGDGVEILRVNGQRTRIRVIGRVRGQMVR